MTAPGPASWIDEARALRAAGIPLEEIAERFDTSRQNISYALKRYLPGKTAPERCIGVLVPAWARDAGLASEYREMATRLDEFAAARHCRALVAEMRAAARADGSAMTPQHLRRGCGFRFAAPALSGTAATSFRPGALHGVEQGLGKGATPGRISMSSSSSNCVGA